MFGLTTFLNFDDWKHEGSIYYFLVVFLAVSESEQS